MNQVTLDEPLPPVEAAVPPPPPPIYAEKPRGKKAITGTGLTLVVERLPKTAERGADQDGGTLWLRDATGQWRCGAIDDAAFETAHATGKLSLVVNPIIDPVEVLIQPKTEDWAQRVVVSMTTLAAS